MDAHRLLGDEIAYELQVRGLPVMRTVAENRSTLRGALRGEKEGLTPTCLQPVDFLDPIEELHICSGKLQDLEDDIQNFDADNRDSEYRRITSRLSHINLRLRRIVTLGPEQEQQRTDLCGRCLQLLDAVGLGVQSLRRETPDVPEVKDDEHVSLIDLDNPIEGSILDEPNPLVPVVAEEENRSRFSVSHHPHPSLPGVQLTMPSFGNFTEGVNHGRASRPTTPYVGSRGLITSTQRQEDRPRESTVRFESNSPRYPFERNPIRTEIPTFGALPTFNSTQNLNDRLQGLNFSNVPTSRETQFRPVSQGYLGPRETGYQNQSSMDFDITRWRIQFSGESSVTDFLERVEELRASRGISKPQLFRKAPELFAKTALRWYRTNTFESWDQLTARLKEDFTPYDYEFDLWEEIRRRTQGSRERVIDYVSAMESLFRKLGSGTPHEEVRVKMIRRNMLPYIQTQLSLHEIHSISDLVRLSRSTEHTAVRAEKFCPPPTNYRQLIEPELAYHKPTSATPLQPTISSVSSAEMVREVPTGGPSPPSRVEVLVPRETRNESRCFNCQETGHRFKTCSRPRRKFCFKCGHVDVTVYSCPQCSSKNQRESRH